jgi:tetratricopeptide (TPR) repeat protein
VAFIDDDQATMAREQEAALTDPQGPWASNWEPRVAAFRGRMTSAHDGFRRSVMLTSQAHQPELSAQFMVQDAESHAVVGQCAEARREAVAAVGLSRDRITIGTAGRALAWCGATAEALSLSGELAQGYPEAILTTDVMVPVIAAANAIQSKQPMRALELLERARRFDHAPVAEFWPAYLRGTAQSHLGHHSEAASEFQSIVDHRGERPDSSVYPLAHLGLSRALAAKGDVAKAREAYLAFFALWKDADSGLVPLKKARVEFTRLAR